MAGTTLNIVQGVTFSGRITVTNSDGTKTNLTGLVASGFVKNKYSSTGTLFNLNPTVHNSYVSGLIDFIVSGSATVSKPVGNFFYDINVYGSNGYVDRISYGTCTVSPIVTK